MDLDEAAGRLYGAPPGEFVAVRTELRRRARAEGDAALARAIGELRKPTVAAWAVNQVARDHPEELADLLDLGERLRRAWRDRDAPALSELTGRRSSVTGRLTRLARRVAAEHGQNLPSAALTEIERTLDAATVDPQAADLVRQGRLTGALSHSGFAPAAGTGAEPAEEEGGLPEGAATEPGKTGETGKDAAKAERKARAGRAGTADGAPATEPGKAAKPEKAAKKTKAKAQEADEAERRRAAELERLRAELRAAAEHAERAVAEAERGHADWEHERDQAEREYRREAEIVADLKSRLAAARERLADAERRLGVVRREEERARRAAAEARRAADRARRALKE